MFGAYILYKWRTTETTEATRKLQAQANIIMMNNPVVKSKDRQLLLGGTGFAVTCARPA